MHAPTQSNVIHILIHAYTYTHAKCSHICCICTSSLGNIYSSRHTQNVHTQKKIYSNNYTHANSEYTHHMYGHLPIIIHHNTMFKKYETENETNIWLVSFSVIIINIMDVAIEVFINRIFCHAIMT